MNYLITWLRSHNLEKQLYHVGHQFRHCRASLQGDGHEVALYSTYLDYHVGIKCIVKQLVGENYVTTTIILKTI